MLATDEGTWLGLQWGNNDGGPAQFNVLPGKHSSEGAHPESSGLCQAADVCAGAPVRVDGCQHSPDLGEGCERNLPQGGGNSMVNGWKMSTVSHSNIRFFPLFHQLVDLRPILDFDP